jgi:hypothetical protein
MKQFVICGNSKEYHDYIRMNNKSPREYVYLHDTGQFYGMSEVHGVFVGTYRERPDIEAVVRTIRLINRIPGSQYIIPPLQPYEWAHTQRNIKNIDTYCNSI